ncbi:hypothetical protein [Scytonema sp. NUACC26]|uniref:hypothetical protein n=1 Tax=Scytonema sp. NUACC26 TaxID=3140176 RepID=UPI0034DBD840
MKEVNSVRLPVDPRTNNTAVTTSNINMVNTDTANYNWCHQSTITSPRMLMVKAKTHSSKRGC